MKPQMILDVEKGSFSLPRVGATLNYLGATGVVLRVAMSKTLEDGVIRQICDVTLEHLTGGMQGKRTTYILIDQRVNLNEST